MKALPIRKECQKISSNLDGNTIGHGCSKLLTLSSKRELDLVLISWQIIQFIERINKSDMLNLSKDSQGSLDNVGQKPVANIT